MKTATRKSQPERLLAYLQTNKKGITTMEAFQHLGITCVHKRVADLEADWTIEQDGVFCPIAITRIKERTASGSIVTRYKLAA